MFKVFVLQTLHNLADEQIEYLIRDRFSFMRFFNLGLEDPVPDATTVWLFREALVKAGLVEKLFDRFGQHLEAKGYLARGGQIVDATIVAAPRQRNSREESEAIKTGKTPEGWEEKSAKNAQKDAVSETRLRHDDARWTKKRDKSFYGYKNHIGVDKTHNLIRRQATTDGAGARSSVFTGGVRVASRRMPPRRPAGREIEPDRGRPRAPPPRPRALAELKPSNQRIVRGAHKRKDR